MGKKLQKPMPVKTDTIELDGDYEGWEFEARLNPPLKVFGDLSSGEFARISPALAKIAIRWNFLNEDGTPLPEKPTLEIIEENINLELATQMANKFVEKLTTLVPN